MGKKKEEKVKLHNKGKREILLSSGQKSMPGRAIDVDKSVAEKYIKAYPFDFVLFEDLVATSDTKKDLKAEQAKNKRLEKEIAELKLKMDEKDPEPETKPESKEGELSEGGE